MLRVVLAAALALLSPVVRAADPSMGGTCLACGQLDFGPFDATTAWQVHGRTLSSETDCAWYGINVRAGHLYEVTTCTPGTASFDARLSVYADDCTLIRTNADACSRVQWVSATTGMARVQVQGGPLLLDTYAYVLAWREGGEPCRSCWDPGGPVIDPLADPGTVSSTPDACLGGWHSFAMTEGATYTFSTCPPGSADGPLTLGLFDPGCRLIATDRTSCGGTSPLLTYVVPPGATGQYALRVQSAAQPAGYRIAYSATGVNCGTTSAPITIRPLQATAEPMSCARTQVVQLSCGSTLPPPIVYTWRVTPPPGGMAVPDRGTVTSLVTGGAAQFTVRLSGLGAHVVEVHAVSPCGSGTTRMNMPLTDATPPLVLPPASRTVECPGAPPVEAPRVRDSCDPAPVVAFSETITPGRCAGEQVVRREWIATDASGNASAPARQVLRVTDTTPPSIVPDTSVKACAYPPDHGRACFTQAGFAPVITDACSAPRWYFARVTHDEAPLGACDPPDAEPDVEIADDGTSFCVRAERCIDDPGLSPGRSYLVEAIAVDACGNASGPVPVGVVLIPQDGTDTSACVVPAPW